MFAGLGVLHVAMLLGLLGVAIPLVIHWLSRRRDPVVDWAAMQFLELGRTSRRWFQLDELMLLLVRMALLAVVALALARPFWNPTPVQAATGQGGEPDAVSSVRRDVVVILDVSESMGRRGADGTTPRDRALAWVESWLKRLGTGDTAAVLAAQGRVRGLVEPSRFDPPSWAGTLAKQVPSARGPSDLAAALAEALRILEKTTNPRRDILILTDNQRFPWRPGETQRWDLLRELWRRQTPQAGLWVVPFPPDPSGPDAAPDGSIGGLTLSRTSVAVGQPLTVTANVSNAGPDPMTRAVSLVLDDQAVPGSSQVVGPVPPGGKVPVRFTLSVPTPGRHAVIVRLAEADDPAPGDDEAAIPLEAGAPLPALLVEGRPNAGPLRGAADFLKLALEPNGDDTPRVRARVVPASGLDAGALNEVRVVVLAGVDRLDAGTGAALSRFVRETGGGLLVVPGPQADPEAIHQALPWLPARLKAWRAGRAEGESVAHPEPSTFAGAALEPFRPEPGAAEAGAGLGRARLFGYRVLEPSSDPSVRAVVSARLDTGDPWVIEGQSGRGRVVLVASPLDAVGGTLPVNPEFVPWIHELVAALAGPTGPKPLRPGEPIRLPLDPPPASEVDYLTARMPSGSEVRVRIVRNAGAGAVAELDETSEPGVYRIDVPGSSDIARYFVVAGDDREADRAVLENAEAESLARGWNLVFGEAEQVGTMGDRVLRSGSAAPRREFGKPLVLVALLGLCAEVWMTRQLVRARAV